MINTTGKYQTQQGQSSSNSGLHTITYQVWEKLATRQYASVFFMKRTHSKNCR